MVPIHTELQAIRERQGELWREADAFRLAREMRAGQPSLRGRVCGAVGGWLMVWGARLQRLAPDVNGQSRPAAVAHGASL